ncbi:MAG: protease degQ, partial [Candidatus Cloacimonetes bacterium]|nr:protease degQ [Candidatus Cloacimonadota bacterium]
MKMWKQLSMALLAISMMSCASAKVPLVDVTSPNPVVQVVKNVREAVVQIRVESKVMVQNNRNPFFDDDFFRQFFPQQPQQQSQPVVSMGSGFIYEYNPSSREAFIMTNN